MRNPTTPFEWLVALIVLVILVALAFAVIERIG